MPIPRLEQVVWSKAMPVLHRHDLQDSAVAAPDLDQLGLPSRGAFSIDGPAVRDRLESLIGARIGAPGGRVLATTGASEAIVLVLASLLDRGEPVLVETPGYEPHRVIPEWLGARVLTFERAREREFGAVAQAVEAALVPGVRVVVLSDPHNPSGVSLTHDDATQLERLAAREDLTIVCDEAFRDASRLPLGTYAARGPRWIGIGSLSKAYGLGALRLGWIAGGLELFDRAAQVQDAITYKPALPSLALANDLVPHLDRLRERGQKILAENHARWKAFADARAQARSDLDVGPTPRGTTAWCRLPGEGDGDRFADFATERHGVAVPRGSFFGDARGFRIGLGSSPERFSPALEALEKAWTEFEAIRRKKSAGARPGALS